MEMKMEMEHFSHQHKLTLLGDGQQQGAEKLQCNICKLTISTGPIPIYGCTHCKYYLHKSCAELPHEIHHPFHPLHPLLLQDYWYKDLCCACGCKTSGFSYRCTSNICIFEMDPNCASIFPSIKYNGHYHRLLALFEEFHFKNYKCNLCNGVCNTFVLRCVQCNFNIHLDCHPLLLRSVKHKNHRHNLTLTDAVVQDDGSEEFYCDACENRREPNLPVYYCKECDFSAHVSCLISEVLPILLADQESHQRTEKIETSGMKNYLGATVGDEFWKSGVWGSIAVDKDPAIAKLDEKITLLNQKVRTIIEELEALKAAVRSKRANNAEAGNEVQASSGDGVMTVDGWSCRS